MSGCSGGVGLGLLAGASAEFLTRQERVVGVVTATGARCTSTTVLAGGCRSASVAPRAPLAQLPVLVAAIYDVLPLEARLDRVALIDSATGELSPLAVLP